MCSLQHKVNTFRAGHELPSVLMFQRWALVQITISGKESCPRSRWN